MHDSPADPDPPERLPPGPDGDTSLEPNVAGALAYLLGPVTGVLFLVLERRNAFVRFHAAQSIGIFVVFFVLWIVVGVVTAVLSVIPIVGFIVSAIAALVSMMLALAGLVLWLFLMYQAWQGNEWEFPVVGPQARKVLLPRT